ncbi:hypothetical protein TWF694_003131 [Orbilia ellipsospora]|uniref:F-box domain-containing protein n=1 Tax=Orbilia ellipsospora TaxID=2528407 RepID=A0AAV9X6Q9_9PEZI
MDQEMVYCSVCGVHIPYYDKRRSWDSRWLQNTVLLTRSQEENIHEDSDIDIRIIPSVLQPSLNPDDPEPISGQFNYYQNKFIPKFDITIFRPESFNDSRRSGYPIHQSCWSIFNHVLQATGVNIPLTKLHQTLYEILDNTAYSAYKLHWSHEYYGIANYQNNNTWTLLPSHSFLEDDPEVDVSAFLTQTSKPFLIPDFLPLPTEIRLTIFSHLTLSDINNLNLIPSATKAQFPDHYWRKFLTPKAKYGYLALSQLPTLSSKTTWYHLFQTAKRECALTGRLRNRHRIWKICKDLSALVVGVAASSPTNLQNLLHDKERELLTTPAIPDPPGTFTVCSESRGYEPDGLHDHEFFGTFSKYSFQSENVLMERMVLHYVGEGEMEFVCGIEMLPADEEMGYLTGRTREVEVGGMEWVTVAMSQYGLVDVSFSKERDNCSWYRGITPKRYADKIAFTRRRLRTSGKDGHEIQLFGKLDASKITLLSFTVPALIPQEDLDDTESLIQVVSWSPSIPVSSPSTLTAGYSNSITWESEKFRPCQNIHFADHILKKITAWTSAVTSYEDTPVITGFTVYYQNEDLNPSQTIGEKDESGGAVGLSIDGAGGEYLVSADVLTCTSGEDDNLVGIQLGTNRGRKGLLTAGDITSPYNFKIWPISLDTGNRITGFYADFDKLSKTQNCSRLGYFGLLSAPKTEIS